MISSQELTDHNCGSYPLEHNPRLIGPSHQISPIGSWTKKKEVTILQYFPFKPNDIPRIPSSLEFPLKCKYYVHNLDYLIHFPNNLEKL